MKRLITLLCLFAACLGTTMSAQTACPGETVFEEKDGLLVIETESLPLTGDWVMDSAKAGYTGRGYIYWSGGQFFGNTSNGHMTVDFRINTPGTYKFTWRMAVGLGQAVSEHNDTWLKINASNFFGRKAGGHVVKPRPACDSDPAADCPAGSSNSGFFKVWGQSTNYIWASWTSDHDAHAIYATFDTAGVYNMTIAARSSWCILDRMVLQLDGTVSDGTARDLDQPQSDCVARTTGLFDQAEHTLRLFPNPTTHTLNIENLTQPQAFEIWDVAGRMMQDGKVGLEGVISLRPELPNGVYLIKVGNQSGRFLKQ